VNPNRYPEAEESNNSVMAERTNHNQQCISNILQSRKINKKESRKTHTVYASQITRPKEGLTHAYVSFICSGSRQCTKVILVFSKSDKQWSATNSFNWCGINAAVEMIKTGTCWLAAVTTAAVAMAAVAMALVDWLLLLSSAASTSTDGVLVSLSSKISHWIWSSSTT